MKKETIAEMEHEVCSSQPENFTRLLQENILIFEVDEVLSEGDDSEEEEEEALKRRLNGGDGSGGEDDEIEQELAMKRARWEREGNFDVPEETAETTVDSDLAVDDSFCEDKYDNAENGGKDEQGQVDDEETRDVPYDDEEDEEIEDMAALIERQVSHEG
ncbi:unnamed protein product [Strongylus vulgaris]|uniref:Uncharacterized protein n=1 Tax=Strongylus vulgaris TaxID=40348 RepID=A0A3P7IAM2_STRVU|nr:unnamed protein product [Strongylus vulgaris]